MKILVTGATGNVDSRVIEALHWRGLDVVAAVRGADSKAEPSWNTREFDFLSRNTWEPALKDVDRIFLMRTLAPPRASH